jgi:hypothetical protein
MRNSTLPKLVTHASLTLWLLVYALTPVNTSASDYPGLGPRGELTAIEIGQIGQPVLVGGNARKQLIVTGIYASQQRHDLTPKVSYAVDKPTILTVAADGLVTPLADGEATITVREPSGKAAEIKLNVVSCGQELPINFVNEIVPIFTKLGCNSGGCHGKSDGQNGFRLSLLGFYPADDYEFLVYEDRGRRIFLGDPEYSLLLQKPANLLPHGGGKRLTQDSYEWQLISRWIGQGTPYGREEDATIRRIEVFPNVREMNFASTQQLSVVAHYSDGTTRDVTRLASYEPNHSEMAACDTQGRVTVQDVPGEVAVMIRFGGEVSVFRAIIPQGLPVPTLPPEKGFVDKLVFSKLKQLGIPPSALCDDSTFIRRVTMDITGRLPTIPEVEQFLADKDANKRDRLVDRLVDSTGYADYFANKWSAVLRNKRRNNNDLPYTYRFHAWIRQSLRENMPYNQFVRNVLTATGDPESHPPVAWFREIPTTNERMEDTAQLFLGMRLACAKCHHHPFERWSQQDYYGFEAFFSQTAMKNSKFNRQPNQPDMLYVKSVEPKARNPRTGLDVPPTALGGEPLTVPAYEDARHQMVDWMTAPSNPFFAKALVNRYWKHFFGKGIVDPEDDLRVTNPPTNPELLEALAKHFVDYQFDLKNLVRTLCKSSVYQLDSMPTAANQNDKQNFSSFYPRRLSAEVLNDAVNTVAISAANFGNIPLGTTSVQLPDNGFNDYFLKVFGKPEAESACECERSVEANLSQSLHLLNSSDMQNRLQRGGGRAAQLAKEDGRTDSQKIRELYLAAFSRPPTAEEQSFVSETLSAYPNKQQAWEDVLWAIFNAKEFQFVR